MGLLDGAVGAVIGGAASLGGAYLSQSSAREAAEMSRENYQHRYQWTMADMKKAGLNPIFAYQTGVGSSPAGVPANLSGAFSGIAEGANTAVNVKRADQERRTLKAQEYNLTMSGDQASANDRLLNQQYRLIAKQFPWMIETVKANAESARAIADANKMQKRLVERDSNFWLMNKELREWQQRIQGFSPLIPLGVPMMKGK
jgi:hypothetical protein